jgi:hypothetical protein
MIAPVWGQRNGRYTCWREHDSDRPRHAAVDVARQHLGAVDDAQQR